MSREYSSVDLVAGTITGAADVVAALTVMGAVGVAVTLHGAAHAGVTVNFEVTDDGGTTWYSAGALDLATGAVVTSVALVANSSKAYQCNVTGFNGFRVRASAWTSGTLSVRIQPVGGE